MIGQAHRNAPRRLVGREGELDLLWSQYRLACAGSLTVALIAGEPGIGKTRLLAEVAERCSRDGALILGGGASDAEGMPPYLPFLEALGKHIRLTPAKVLQAQAGHGAHVLLGILPELGTRIGNPQDAPSLPPEQARLRLFEAVGEFVAAIAAARSLVLALDDLQWADSASLDLLCHVAGHQSKARLLVLGCCQDSGPRQNPALDRTLTELARLRRLNTITLPRLTREQIEECATAFLRSAVDEAVVSLLLDQSEGNPFFIEELLYGWLEGGVLVAREGRYGLRTASHAPVPSSILGAIRIRLSRLPPVTVDQLRVAAIIGRAFGSRLLAQVQAMQAPEVEEILEEACRGCLVAADGNGFYRFTHDKIRESLYSEVSSARRMMLHERIGQALEAQTDETTAQRLAELAFHFARSGDRERGAEYSFQAAQSALRAFAFDQSITHCQTALDLIPRDDRRRGPLLLALGEAALLSGLESRAAAAYRAAEVWFEARADRSATARAAHGHGLACWRQGSLEEARLSFERALALSEGADHLSADGIQTRVDLAMLLGVALARQEAAIGHGYKALDLAREGGAAGLEASAGRTVGFLLVLGNQIAAGLPLLEQALQLADRSGDDVEASECCSGLAQAYVWSGDFQRSLDVSLRRVEYARRCRQPYRLRYVYSWLGFVHAAQGQWQLADEALLRAEAEIDMAPSESPRAFFRQVRGFLTYQRGDYTQAESDFREALRIFREKDPLELVLCGGMLALTLVARGDRQSAQACVEEQERLLGSVVAGSLPIASAHSCLGLAAALLGDEDRIGSYYEAVLPYRGQYHWFLVDRVLGALALSLGKLDEASEHLRRAETLAARQSLKPELGRIAVSQAQLALSLGGTGAPDEAAASLQRAVTVFEAQAMDAELLSARELRRQLTGSLRTAPGLLPRGLTGREAEVLRLLAAGMSNRQIACQLSLSENTVAKHLTSIYGKLGVQNRAAAVAFAIRNALG
jgi:ATP/maltotriose-dependent transcriptional regulator MalT